MTAFAARPSCLLLAAACGVQGGGARAHQCQGGFALGPALDPLRRGVPPFSGSLPGRNRGKSDIYAIRYRMQR